MPNTRMIQTQTAVVTLGRWFIGPPLRGRKAKFGYGGENHTLLVCHCQPMRSSQRICLDFLALVAPAFPLTASRGRRAPLGIGFHLSLATERKNAGDTIGVAGTWRPLPQLHSPANPELRIREHAAARAAVERIAPQRLHRESAGREVDVRRRALIPRGDPGALVAVLGSAGV